MTEQAIQISLVTRLWQRTRQHASVDWLFFRMAIGITVGLLPFWAAELGQAGIFVAGLWAACYLLLIVPGVVLCGMLTMDSVLVTCSRQPRFWPVLRSIAEQPALREKVERTSPPAIRAYGRLSAALGFWLSPFGLMSILLSIYIEMSKPITITPRFEEAGQRAFEAGLYVEIRRRERRIEEMEIDRSEGVLA